MPIALVSDIDLPNSNCIPRIKSLVNRSTNLFGTVTEVDLRRAIAIRATLPVIALPIGRRHTAMDLSLSSTCSHDLSIAMALTFAAGDRTLTLSHDDIKRRPGSLLHSLTSSVSSKDGPVTLRVDDLPGSPFASWPAALEVTAALYK